MLLPLSVWVSLHLPRAIFSGSLYGLLTCFCGLTLPRVRFSPVWPSTGRTVSERWVWRVVAVGGGADEVFDGAVCVSRKHSEHPDLLQAGVFFHVGASYSCVDALRAYRQGRSQSGSMCALSALTVTSPRVRRKSGDIDRHTYSVSLLVKRVGRRSPANVTHNSIVLVVVSGVSSYSS